MKPMDILKAYYKHANAGQWDKWCDLFAENMIMDEQLAGKIRGLATLRKMMGGMKKMYKVFRNKPKHILVSGNHGAAVSHITAVSRTGVKIKSDAMNYFRFKNGKIVYMANFHDSKPFAAVMK